MISIYIKSLIKADDLITALDHLNGSRVSLDNIKELHKNWPETFDELIDTAKENPNVKWDKAE